MAASWSLTTRGDSYSVVTCDYCEYADIRVMKDTNLAMKALEDEVSYVCIKCQVSDALI
jgi:DNA-directed RNA polymerase subunit RPC12/RpoP